MTYVDAYIKLAEMELKRNQYVKGLEYCDQALMALQKYKVKNDLPLSFKAFIYYQARSIEESITTLKRIRRDLPDHDDVYNLVFMGKLEYDISCRFRDNTKEQDLHLKEAFENFKKALNMDESSHLAALGMAIIRGESGKLIESQKAFLNISENYQTDNVQLVVNMGHLEFLAVRHIPRLFGNETILGACFLEKLCESNRNLPSVFETKSS